MSEEQNSNSNNGANNPPAPPGDNQSAAAAPKVISLAIKDPAVLYSAYMQFVSKGGLFIPTKKAFNMGDMLSLVISIDDTAKYPIDGKVVWITPSNSSSRTPGIGVQFTGSNAEELSKKIQNALIGKVNNSDRTNTM